MSELENFQLDDGSQVSTGLLMPTAEDLAVMATVQEYPEGLFLEDNDLKKAFADDYYLQSRKIFSPWMINQGPDGKCNASAGDAGLEQIRHHQGLEHIPLADSHLYMNINGGRNSGSALIDAFKYLQEKGISPSRLVVDGKETTFPLRAYNRRQVSTSLLKVADAAALKIRGFEFYRAPLDYANFKRCVASALARRQPVIFAWHVARGRSERLSNGYVQVGRGPGNHANCFHSAKWVGGSDLVHPDDRNSWGPSKDPIYGPTGSGWGDGGFGLFTMQDAFACNQNHYTYIMTSAKVNSLDDVVNAN